MSEAEAGIDPRFDPRFQRGYVPDAAAADPAVFPFPRQVPVPADTPRGNGNIDGTAAEPEPAPGPERGREPEPEPERERDPEQPEPVFAALFEPSAGTSPAFTAWFAAGWGVSVVVAVLGVSLWWASIASQNYYSGPSADSDRWLQAFGWMVAPSLVEAGLLGLVVMLVWTGLRHARRNVEPM